MTSFAFQVLSLIIPQYIEVHSHTLKKKKHQNDNYWAQILNMEVKEKSKDLFFQLRHVFIEWFRKLLGWSGLQFYFLYLLEISCSLGSIKKQISSLELKVPSTMKLNRKVRKVLDSPHLDFQDADCEVIRESLGTQLQAHFAVCYKFCVCT